MAKVKRAKRKTTGKFYVAPSSYGDLEIFTTKPKGKVTKEQDQEYDPKTGRYKPVKTETVDYGYGDQSICEQGFADVTGREVKEGECWRVDFKLTRVDRAAQAARAKKAKRAKRR